MSGKEIIPPKYDYSKDFTEGIAAVRLNGKWGFVDQTGKEIIPPKYEDTNNYSEGLVAVQQDDE
jgi:hypothetical protein